MTEIPIASILGELVSYLITGGIISYIIYKFVSRKRKEKGRVVNNGS